MSLISTILNVPVPELPALPPGVMGQLGADDHDRVCHLRRVVFLGRACREAWTPDGGAHHPLDLALAVAHFSVCAVDAGARSTEVDYCLAHGARGEG